MRKAWLQALTALAKLVIRELVRGALYYWLNS
jgi:hypothetical protein